MLGLPKCLVKIMVATVLLTVATVSCAYAVSDGPGFPDAAPDSSSLSEKRAEGEQLMLEGPQVLELAFFDVRRSPFTTEPSSIEVGISCGMKGMCGEDPCLCGSSDAWGHCSCNGLEEVRPTFRFVDATSNSDVGFVHFVEAFGRTWVVTFGSGEVDAQVVAGLEHFEDAYCTVHVTAAPFGPLDALKIVAIVAVVVLVAFGLYKAVRTIVSRKRPDHSPQG